MASDDEPKYDERLLVRYLLAALSREETERLDELSIVDEDFDSRLSAAENELVDAYVRKELSQADLEKFTSSYLSSPRRRQKVEFAETMLAFESSAKTRVPTPAAVPEAEGAPVGASSNGSSKKVFRLGWVPRLAYAGVALALLVMAGYLFRQNLDLRKQMSAAQAQQTSLLQHQQQLEQEVAQQRSTNTEVLHELEQVRASQTNLDQLKTVALLLLPPTRGATKIPALSVHPGTDLAVLVLTLESDEFPVYQAMLKDPVNNSIVWRSANLQPSPAGEKKAVSISFPAGLLKQQNYIVELAGIPAKGAPENVAAYHLRVVLK